MVAKKALTETDGDMEAAVDWLRKDMGLVMDQAKSMKVSVPVTAMVDQFYADVQAMGGGRWDTSSLIQRLRRLQGT